MDWSGCELVEMSASGVSMVKGTSVPAELLLEEIKPFWKLNEIAGRYPQVQTEQLERVLTYAVERWAWDTKTLVDWNGCALVERVAGRCSGAPTVVGSRIFPDTIAEYYWGGANVQEMLEHYPSLSEQTIAGLIEYVKLAGARAA